MKIDLTYRLEKEWIEDFLKNNMNGDLSKFGHFGTHFDIQDKEFPLEYCERKGIIFDVSFVQDRDIEVSDLNINAIEQNSIVLIHTGIIENIKYGTVQYFNEHPQLSYELIEKLIEMKVSLIGIDMAGVRRGTQHVKADQYCADHNIFIIENLVQMKQVVRSFHDGNNFIVHTYPLNLAGYTGLPARVIAEFKSL